jgi:membrane-associated HD superfamily phosphohydrolase
MKKRGRKEKYTTHIKPFLEDITKWIREGQTEYCIFEKLGVSEDAWYKYKIKYNELKEAVIKGEQQLTKHIESQLYKRCNGYEYTETKTYISEQDKKKTKRIEKTTKFVNPSDTAIIFALKNRDPDNWKDRQEIKQNINQRLENIIIDIDKEEE